jgi:hypothetical protein
MEAIHNVLYMKTPLPSPLHEQPIYVDGRRVTDMDRLVYSHEGHDVTVIACAAVQSPHLPPTEWFLAVVVASGVPKKCQRNADTFSTWLLKHYQRVVFAIDATEAHWPVQA